MTSKLFDMAGKVAVVTGSSRGIGRAIAIELARAGARVVVSSRKADACNKVRDEIAAEGGEAVVIPCNISSRDDCVALIEGALDCFGRLDALVCNAATVTSIANDYGYEATFERQVRAIGRAEDALIGISTSGNSPNVLAALRAARDLGMVTVALTGERVGAVDEVSDYCLKVPSAQTPRIQEMHVAVGHMLCELIEEALG